MTEHDPNDDPTIDGREGVLEYCHARGILGVTAWSVGMAVRERKLVPHLIGGRKHYFTPNEVHRWLASMRQPEPTRFCGANKDRGPKSGAADTKSDVA